jgi:hypothetical protein
MAHLLLTYGTATGMAKTIRIPHVNPAVSASNVREATSMILNANAFDGRNGPLQHMRSATLVETFSTPFNVL